MGKVSEGVLLGCVVAALGVVGKADAGSATETDDMDAIGLEMGDAAGCIFGLWHLDANGLEAVPKFLLDLLARTQHDFGSEDFDDEACHRLAARGVGMAFRVTAADFGEQRIQIGRIGGVKRVEVGPHEISQIGIDQF